MQPGRVLEQVGLTQYWVVDIDFVPIKSVLQKLVVIN